MGGNYVALAVCRQVDEGRKRADKGYGCDRDGYIRVMGIKIKFVRCNRFGFRNGPDSGGIHAQVWLGTGGFGWLVWLSSVRAYNECQVCRKTMRTDVECQELHVQCRTQYTDAYTVVGSSWESSEDMITKAMLDRNTVMDVT